MIFWELVKTAWQSLKTNPKRSVLTMIGIIIGVSSVITIMALGNGLKDKMLSQFKLTADGNTTIEMDYYPNNGVNVDTQGFDQVDINLIKDNFKQSIANIKIDHSNLGAPINLNGNLGNREHLFSIGLVRGASQKYEIVDGKNISISDNMNGQTKALLDANLAKKEYGNSHNAIGTSINLSNQTYEIIGTFKHPKDNLLDNNVNVILPKVVFMTSNSSQSGDSLQIILKQDVNVKKTANSIKTFLKKNGQHRHEGTYTYVDIGKELRKIKKMFNALTYFVSAIAAISLFIAGIGVMNMMYISVSERTQEIGVRLAIGGKPANIMTQFLLEAITLTLAGGLIGFILGWSIVKLLVVVLPFHPVVSVGSFILAVGISSSVGIVFGILPARLAAQKNLIDTLR